MKTARPRGRPATATRQLSPVGKLLRELRGELTITAAAAKVGRDNQWWRRREIQGYDVTIDDLAAIARGFACGFLVDAKGLRVG